MSATELSINIGKVDLQDKLQLVTKHLQEGRQIVFVEEDYAHHTIYVTSELIETLGGSGTINELIRNTFNAVSETDKTKTRFFFGHNFDLEGQKGEWFDIYYPDGSYIPLEVTEKTFLQGIQQKNKTGV